MTRTAALRKMSALLFVVASAVAVPAWATLFTDDTFNLSNYATTEHQTGGATINIVQIPGGGNPGAALQIISIVPATTGAQFSSAQYLLNRSFTYDPQRHGAVKSIDFSSDLYFQASAGFNVTTAGADALLFQGVNAYVHTISLPATPGVFQTASAAGLQATDFNLVTDVTTFATDPTKHPNFASGTLQFGLASGWFSLPNSIAFTGVVRSDNLSISINAVPEPQTYSMILAALALLGFLLKRSGHRTDQ